MTIAIDYDGTWSRDAKLFQSFAEQCRTMGHEAIIVTMRSREEGLPLPVPLCEVIFTNRKPKKAFCETLGINVDVWIDDQPFFIYQNG